MTSSEIKHYVTIRNNELSADEVLHVVDTTRNECIDHIVYENGIWKAWCNDGTYVEFRKRNW